MYSLGIQIKLKKLEYLEYDFSPRSRSINWLSVSGSECPGGHFPLKGSKVRSSDLEKASGRSLREVVSLGL